MPRAAGHSNTAPSDRYRLRAYRPGLSQRPHAHSEPHLSLLISGSLVEECRGRERRTAGGSVAVRQRDFAHQVRFGSSGALILSLAVDGSASELLDALPLESWVEAPAPLLRASFAAALKGEEEDVLDCVWDMIARHRLLQSTPRQPWLISARDALIEEDASISALAARAGVHRVYFSRAFAGTFGDPPSLYRRRVRALRAAAAAIRGESGGAAAYDCGFSDQSHMCRALRQTTGLSFKHLTRLRAEVTSIQE